MNSISSISSGASASGLLGFQKAVQQMRDNQQKRQEKFEQIQQTPSSNMLTNKSAGASPLDLPKPNTLGGQYQPPSKSMLPPSSGSNSSNDAFSRLQETMAEAAKSVGMSVYQQAQSVSNYLSNGSTPLNRRRTNVR